MSCQILHLRMILSSLYFRLIPTIGDIITFFIFIHKNIWVDWRQSHTIWHTISDFFGAMQATIVGLFAPGEVQPAVSWGIVDGCTSCLTHIQTEGISGMCTYCWSCTAATISSPSTLFEGCWTSISAACSSSAEFCSSCSGALMEGPTGVATFCSSTLSACSDSDSLFNRCLGGFSYVGSSVWSGLVYIGSSISACGAQYGPVLYEQLIRLRDFLWSCLMWLWRQVRMFFT